MQSNPPPAPAWKRDVRIGVVQWQMRPAARLEEILAQAEPLIQTLADYEADFVLFPEYLTAPLLAAQRHLPPAEGIRALAGFSGPLREAMCGFARRYRVNIITGSMPLLEGNTLCNAAYLCRRDGTWERVCKIHITPSERQAYGMTGGGHDDVRVLETDCGRIGILICYDVEFPELPRLLRAEGMEILFVPFMTDIQTGYQRVRFCAQARAVENECYVALAGSVGTLPGVANMDIQYSQSVVFSPSDFGFPASGIVAEAAVNAEMLLVCDVDRERLRALQEKGSVRNWQDRREDLYELRMRHPGGEGGGRHPA